MAFGVAILAVISGCATYALLTGLTSIVPTGRPADAACWSLATVLVLVVIISREIWKVLQARRRRPGGRAAAYPQIVALFAAIAVVPAVLVAVVANLTLSRGLDRLFSERTRAVIKNSLTVANTYVNEHARLIRGDASHGGQRPTPAALRSGPPELP